MGREKDRKLARGLVEALIIEDLGGVERPCSRWEGLEGEESILQELEENLEEQEISLVSIGEEATVEMVKIVTFGTFRRIDKLGILIIRESLKYAVMDEVF